MYFAKDEEISRYGLKMFKWAIDGVGIVVNPKNSVAALSQKEAQEMASNEEFKKEIAEIMGDLECPKDFNCHRSGFKNVCKAMDIGRETYVQCMEEHPDCPFVIPFGISHYCKCPLRVFIAKKLKQF